jgi:hypothetical protein
VIPERNAREAITSARQGQNVSQIARGLGHDRKTIRIYLNGSRAPGKTRSHPGTFVPFAGYAAQRIAGDPHLRTAGLHGELAALGYRGSYSALRACPETQVGCSWCDWLYRARRRLMMMIIDQ